ncbi:MAG: protein kinase [Verrucomicrobiota bacterium]
MNALPPVSAVKVWPPSLPELELLQRIGSGSYGEVWLARNPLGTLRAVKIVRRSEFGDDRPYDREFAGLRKFEPISRSHEGFVDLLQIGRNDEEGYFYYVMELADAAHPETAQPYQARTLAAEVKARGALPLDECIRIAHTLTGALAELHRHGLVHRDIKPSNIVFVNGVPKLADIGLVANANEARSFVGTEGFIPPEGPGTPRADIFSLGIVLYVMSTGKTHHDFPEPPADLASRLDHGRWLELQAIVHRACQADPRERYASAEATLREVELFQRGRSVRRSHAREKIWKFARRTLFILAAFSTICAAAIFAFRELNRDQPLSSIPDAQRLYDQAVLISKDQTRDRQFQAFTNLIGAVKLDPQFADAYFRISTLYFGPGGEQLPPRSNFVQNIRWVAERLRDLNPDSAQYHAIHSYVEFLDWHFAEAVTESERASRLKWKARPASAHGFHAWIILRARGDAATALREFKAAERIDYSDVGIQTQLGTPYYAQRDFSQAIEHYWKALRLEPGLRLPHSLLARAYEADKQYRKALDEYEIEEKMWDPANAAPIEAQYQKWRAILAEQDGTNKLWQAMLNRPLSPYKRARLKARLGLTTEVFALLNQACEEHEDDGEADFLIDDCWDPFRDDPRFKQLLRKAGLSRVGGGIR